MTSWGAVRREGVRNWKKGFKRSGAAVGFFRVSLAGAISIDINDLVVFRH